MKDYNKRDTSGENLEKLALRKEKLTQLLLSTLLTVFEESKIDDDEDFNYELIAERLCIALKATEEEQEVLSINNAVEPVKRERYEVTVTCTGSIIVRAESENDAIDIVNSMRRDDTYAHASLTGFEASDAILVEDLYN